MQFIRPYLGTLLALGGGVLAGLGMAFPPLWFLPIVGVLGYFAASRLSSTIKAALLHGLLFGVIASMGGVWWFWDTIPLTWISIPEGPTQFLLVGMVYSLAVLALALPFMLGALLIRSVPSAWYRPLVLALLYVLIEEVRMWSFALFFLGAETSLAPHFSIAGLGYALTESTLLLPLAQLGHFGLNGFIALLAATFLERKRLPVLLGGAVIVLSLVGTHLSLPPLPTGETIRVGLISTNVPAGPFALPGFITQQMQEAEDAGAEVLAIPEGLGLAKFLDREARQQWYETVFEGRNGLVVSASVVPEENGTERGELIYETVTDGIIASQDKIFFVPMGEYLPPLVEAAISVVGTENLGGYSSYLGNRLVPGSTLTPATYEGIRFGSLLCSELLSPYLYPKLAAQHTDLLLNLANNSWFHSSRLLHERLQQLAKTHALKNRQWFLVASNGSPSYAIDPRGRVVSESAWGANTPLLIEVPRP